MTLDLDSFQCYNMFRPESLRIRLSMNHALMYSIIKDYLLLCDSYTSASSVLAQHA